jgi:hypothetical protein
MGFNTNSAGDEGITIGSSFGDDTQDFYIYDLYDNALRLIIDSAGKVGIGDASPAVGLDVHWDNEISAGFGKATTDTNYISIRTLEEAGKVAGVAFMVGDTTQTGVSSTFQLAGVAGKVINANSGSALQGELGFHTNSGNSISQKMVLDKDGKLGIGETAPTAPLHIKAAPINTSGSRSAQLYIEDTTAFGSTQNSGIQFRQEWQSGSVTSTSAIVGTRTSTSSGNYGGALIFQTRANGGDLADSMIIQDDGDVGIGVTDPESRLEVKGSSIGKKLFVVHSSGTDSQCYGQEIKFDSADPDNESQYFLSCEDSAAARFRIYSSGDTWSSDGGAVNSDERLKENIVDASSKLDDINKLKVRNFNWRETDSETGKTIHKGDTSSKKRIGFIAQELETVFPALVQEYDQDTEGKGEVMRKGIKHTALIPILVKAVQELSAKVEALESA